MSRGRSVASVGVAALLAAACGTGPGTTDAGSGTRGSITVLAAASLTDSFTRIADDFEADHPDTEVVLSFGPSSGLARSIAGGSPADVFAAASDATMDTVTSAGLAADATPFATNALQVVVPAANPGRVTGLADLAKPEVTVALCQAQVPCGSVAEQVLTRAGLTVTPVTEEVDVRAVLTKVRLGEVDAGLVYVTDVRAAGDQVRGIEIPAETNASTTYPIAALSTAPNPSLARAFVDHVLSADGQRVLADAGFGAP